MNYVVYYSHECEDGPIFEYHEKLENARQDAQLYAKQMPGVEVFIAQKISTFISEFTIKET